MMTHLFHNRIMRMTIMSMFVLSLLLAPVVANVAFADQIPSGGQDAKIPTSSAVGNYIGNFMLNVTSIVTWFGGALLEKSIQMFILDTSTLIRSGTQFGQVIENIWKLVRDIANLAFIFGFIYIGLATIIKPDSQSTKRMIASIIIGALLINFSLFFVRFIVDVSNYLAVEIHNTMITGTGSISAKIGDALGMGSWFAPPQNDFGSTTRAGNVAFFFMGAIFLVVAGFVLAAGALLLITRFVALVFIMIFSPLMFAATVFPQTAHLAGRLWGELFRYAFFAPTYLFLLIISIQVLDGIIGMLNGNKESTLEALQTGAIGVIAYFVLAIMFLIFSLQLAQKFGVAGANRVVGGLNSVRRGAQGYMGRGALRISGVGAGATAISKRIEEGEKSNKFSRRLESRAARAFGVGAASHAVTSAKFGSSTSYSDTEKKNKELNRARVQHVQSSDFEEKIRVGSMSTATDTERIAMERAMENASTEQLKGLLDTFKEGTPERAALIGNMSSSQFENLMKLKPEDLDDEKKAKLRQLRQTHVQASVGTDVGKASASTLEALGATHLSQPANAVQLTASQMDDLKKKLTPTEYKIISNARESALTTVAAGTSVGGVTKQNILSRKPGEISKLPTSVLKSLSTELPVSVLEAITRNGELSKPDQAEIRLNIEHAIKSAPVSASNTQQLIDYDDWLNKSPLGKQFGK